MERFGSLQGSCDFRLSIAMFMILIYLALFLLFLFYLLFVKIFCFSLDLLHELIGTIKLIAFEPVF